MDSSRHHDWTEPNPPARARSQAVRHSALQQQLGPTFSGLSAWKARCSPCWSCARATSSPATCFRASGLGGARFFFCPSPTVLRVTAVLSPLTKESPQQHHPPSNITHGRLLPPHRVNWPSGNRPLQEDAVCHRRGLPGWCPTSCPKSCASCCCGSEQGPMLRLVPSSVDLASFGFAARPRQDSRDCCSDLEQHRQQARG